MLVWVGVLVVDCVVVLEVVWTDVVDSVDVVWIDELDVVCEVLVWVDPVLNDLRFNVRVEFPKYE